MAVYFIRNTENGCIKIGCSGDPEARLRQLQTASPHKLELLGCVEGGPAEERELHDLFGEFRLEGEWFGGNPHVERLGRFLVSVARGQQDGTPKFRPTSPMIAEVYYFEARQPDPDGQPDRIYRSVAITPYLDPFGHNEMRLPHVAIELTGMGFRLDRIELLHRFDLYAIGLSSLYGGSESDYSTGPDGAVDDPICMGGIALNGCWSMAICNLAVGIRVRDREIAALRDALAERREPTRPKSQLLSPEANGVTSN